jgi:lipopolysaccharide/colanic/teichoic acid biosynthesis glycosyltransferase
MDLPVTVQQQGCEPSYMSTADTSDEQVISGFPHSCSAHVSDWLAANPSLNGVGSERVVPSSRSLPGSEILQIHRQEAFAGVGYEITKRTLDVAVRSVALIILSPVFAVAALAIKLCDRGPVMFSQVRVGRDGHTFRCFKFRSMNVDADGLQAKLAAKSDHSDLRTFKMADDPRITPVGRFLRRFSIDELPQMLNVLLGQMSLVGPRPPLPHEVALYTNSDLGRLAVRPGLTCIWQVSGRSRIPFPEQLAMDLEYIRRRSLFVDLRLILQTFPAVLTGDGAA